MAGDIRDLRRIGGEKLAGRDTPRLQHGVGEIQVSGERFLLIRKTEIGAPSAALAIVQRSGHLGAGELRQIELVVAELEKAVDAEIETADQALSEAEVEIVVALS